MLGYAIWQTTSDTQLEPVSLMQENPQYNVSLLPKDSETCKLIHRFHFLKFSDQLLTRILKNETLVTSLKVLVLFVILENKSRHSCDL